MAKTYRKKIQIRFRDADPARILYFANLFSLSHDCFEDFIQEELGMKWEDWFRNNPALVPIRHTESDYLIPFLPGEFYEITVSVAQIRETSMQMKYVFSKDGRKHAEVKMVHAFIDPQSKQKTKVPEKWRTLFSPYLEAQS